MSHVQSSAEPALTPPESPDNAIEPVVRRKSLGYNSSPDRNPPLELPSSPYRNSSPPLQLGSSPHQSPPFQARLGHHSPPLALRSSPYQSPSPPHRSPSSEESHSRHYSPTLHQSLSPSPPHSPSQRHQNPPFETRETQASVPVTAAAEPASTSEETVRAYENPEPLTEPLPTKVNAYKPRGIRSNKLNALSIANVALRAFAAVFTLISFSVIASDKDTLVVSSLADQTVALRFHDLFYLSYLLTANVIAFAYLLVTMGIFMYHLNSGKPVVNIQLLVGVFALDQILSYLLMSASSSAATGIRAQTAIIDESVFDNFVSQAYAGVAMSFIAFFLLAAASLISGYHLFNRKRLTF